MGKVIDLSGLKFGRLKVLEYVGLDSNNQALWKCICECGCETTVLGKLLRNGHTKSCGCYKREQTIVCNTTHGLCKHPLYNVWCHMKRRCYNIDYPDFKDYGARGISICDEWRYDFKSFYDWSMKNGYKPGLYIDRINNDGNYEPSNCRWTNMSVQANNTRRIHAITYNGKTQSMLNWCKELDMDYYTVRSRLNNYHWTVERAFTTPTRRGFHEM